MPIYEYECHRCGERFEELQGLEDDPVEACPHCNGPVRRLLGTGAAVISKGSPARAGDSQAATPRCGRGAPCCGRDTRCDRPPCDR